jgi:(p)ppGpp synthase/HD superfamily hydrolase
MTHYEKLFVSLRYWLHGRNYMQAAEALHFAACYHQGTRKDGVTPEFEHQLRIVHYLRTLEKNLIYPEATLTTGILHDVVEDYSVSVREIIANFGQQVGHSVWLLTKKKDGVSRSPEEYFRSMEDDPIASIDKGADRVHNFQSMVEVFTPDKQRSYIDEARTRILPMLKQARRKHPRQELAYENVKLVLVSQIELIEHALTVQK